MNDDTDDDVDDLASRVTGWRLLERAALEVREARMREAFGRFVVESTADHDGTVSLQDALVDVGDRAVRAREIEQRERHLGAAVESFKLGRLGEALQERGEGWAHERSNRCR